MITLDELRAQHARIEEAIAQTEPAFRGGLYHAAGELVTMIHAHPDYQPTPPVLCVCCDRPATILSGDWDLCEGCHAAIAAFDAAEVEELWLP